MWASLTIDEAAHGVEGPPVATGPIPIVAGNGVHLIAPHVRAALRRSLHGREWAVGETARLLGPSISAGRRRMPDPLPVIPRVLAELAPALGALRDDERMTLLIAAVAVEPRTDVLLAAVGSTLDEVLDGPAPSYLRFVAGAFAFDDPMMRAAVHQTAGLGERTRAHRALRAAYAGAGDTAASAWHGALAALTGDPAVVDPLVLAARLALGAGDAEVAQRIACEAASHAVDDAARARCRRVEALASFAAGHLETAAELGSAASDDAAGCVEAAALHTALASWPLAAPHRIPALVADLGAAFGLDVSSAPLPRAAAACALAWDAAVSGDLQRAHALLASSADELPLGAVPDARAARLARRVALLVGDPRLEALADELEAHGGAPARGSGARLRDRALHAALAGRADDAAAFASAALAEPDRDPLPYLDVVDTLVAASAGPAAEAVAARMPAQSPVERLRRALAVAAAPSVETLAAQALALPHPSAYEAGTTALAAARALRRHDRPGASRAHYHVAAEHFAAAGAHAWVVAVRHEADAAAPRGDDVRVDRPGASTRESRVVAVPAETASAAGLELLTAREREVVAAIAEGLPNREVALRLCMSVRTVEVHLGRVFRKLGVGSRVELALLVHRRPVRETA